MAITKASSSAVAPAAKGDLVVGNATNDSGVLAVGSTDQVLTVDSSTATGLKWATPSAGGMTLLSTTTLSGTTTDITGIDQNYKDLLILFQGIYFNVTTEWNIRPNDSNLVNLCSGTYGNAAYVMDEIRGIYDSPTTNPPTHGGFLRIHGYAGTTYGKPFQFAYSFASNAINFGGNIKTTSAITSLKFYSGNLTSTYSGGQVRIYGVK